jgi:hypothetical protein
MFDIPKEDLMDKNLTQLRELADKLNNNIADVNHGGCCCVAVEIAKHLRKIYPTKIRVSTDYDDYADTNVEDVAKWLADHGDGDAWNDNGIFFGHVVVEFKYKGRNYHIDTNGVKRAGAVDPTFGWILYPGELPYKAAKVLADQDSGVWNWTFNRDQIPKMRKIIDNFFKAAQLTQP